MKKILTLIVKKLFGSSLISYLFALFGLSFSFSKFIGVLVKIFSKFTIFSVIFSHFLREQIKRDITFWPFLLNTVIYLWNKVKTVFHSKELNEEVKPAKSVSIRKQTVDADSILQTVAITPKSKVKLFFLVCYRVLQLLLLLSIGSVIVEHNPSAVSEVSVNFETIFSAFKDYLLSFAVLLGSSYIYAKDFCSEIFQKYSEFVYKTPGFLKFALEYLIGVIEQILLQIKNFFGISNGTVLLPAPTEVSVPAVPTLPNTFPVEIPWKRENVTTQPFTTEFPEISKEEYAKRDSYKKFSSVSDDNSGLVKKTLVYTAIGIAIGAVVFGTVVGVAYFCGIDLSFDVAAATKSLGNSTRTVVESTSDSIKNFPTASYNYFKGNPVSKEAWAAAGNRLELYNLSNNIQIGIDSNASLLSNFYEDIDNINLAIAEAGSFPLPDTNFFRIIGEHLSSFVSSPASSVRSAVDIESLSLRQAADLLNSERLMLENPPIVLSQNAAMVPGSAFSITLDVLPFADLPTGFAWDSTVVEQAISPLTSPVNPLRVLGDCLPSPISDTSALSLLGSPEIGVQDLEKSVSSLGSMTPLGPQFSSSLASANVVQDAVNAAASAALQELPAVQPYFVPEALSPLNALDIVLNEVATLHLQALPGNPEELPSKLSETYLNIYDSTNPLTAPIAAKSNGVFSCYSRARCVEKHSTVVAVKNPGSALSSPTSSDASSANFLPGYTNSPVKTVNKIFSTLTKKNNGLTKLQTRNFSSEIEKEPNFNLPWNLLTGEPIVFSPAIIRRNKRIKDSFLFIKDYYADSSWDNAFLLFLTVDLFEELLKEFWTRVMSDLKDTEYVILLIRIEHLDNYSTLDKVKRVSKFDQEALLENISGILASLSEDYRARPVYGITLDYMVRENHSGKPLRGDFLAPALKERIRSPDRLLKKSTDMLKKFDLPLNTNYKEWGEIEYDSLDYLIIKDPKNKDKKYFVDFLTDSVNRTVIEVKIKGKLILKVEDVNASSGSFTRKLNSSEYFISNNKIKLKMSTYKTDVLRPIKKDKKLVNKFITLDIETMLIDGEHTPYCICFYDGVEKYSFYLSDYGDYNEMLKSALESMLRAKYSGYVIYAHNLSKFDGIFLLNPLVELCNKEQLKINPVFREDCMINIGVNFGPKNKYNISFRDSYLLLPLSLQNLSNQFKVGQVKTIFPYKFLNDKINKNIDLNYIGTLPGSSYFSSEEEYSKYLIDYSSAINSGKRIKKNFLSKWSLKNETVRYCLNDCVSLHEVLVKFNEFIFNKFKLNIQVRPTLPSLTFAIFRSNYLAKIEKQGYYIPLINGKTYLDIKQSYTGGSTDMFVPTNPKGTKTFGYDVNSLYPKSMGEGMLMPVLSRQQKYLKYFEGDISRYSGERFGFFNCEVKTTKNLMHPILQVRHVSIKGAKTDGTVKNSSGLRTISPLGCWNSMYFSEELKNAKKYGYEYKIKSGYLFDKFDIFAEFIEELYKIKEAHTPADSWYSISKLLMNSLYGRFGMDPNFENTAIINDSELDKYLETFDIFEKKYLEHGKLLITYKETNSRSHGESREKAKNVSIPIASAITAYARIFMSQFKNNPNFILYYTDTDSIYVSEKLDDEWVSNKLGKFKLENIFTEVIFLAPKVYGGITESGEEIVKVKGFKTKVPFSELEKLLIKDSSVELKQEKWFKSLEKSSITVTEQNYTLMATQNKRELIYENDKLVNTVPFILNECGEQEAEPGQSLEQKQEQSLDKNQEEEKKIFTL